MKKIEVGTDKGLFNWLLANDNNAELTSTNSAMIRVLVKKHNEMVDAFNELLEKKYQEGFEQGYDNGIEDANIKRSVKSE